MSGSFEMTPPAFDRTSEPVSTTHTPVRTAVSDVPRRAADEAARHVVDRFRSPVAAPAPTSDRTVIRRFLMPAQELSDSGESGRHLGMFARKHFQYLSDQLVKYHAAPPGQKPHYLDKIVTAADAWLTSNENSDKPEKRPAVEKLRRQATTELGLAQAATGNSSTPEVKPVTSRTGAILQPAYEAVNGPLFPEDPCADHVHQGALGDCFLLATAAAIAEKDPDLIREMMSDNGGTVSVRLYTDQGAEYVTVDKSIPMVTVNDPESGLPVQRPPYVRGALWVQMLEKAHAAKKGRYADLEGGTGAMAIGALLGVASESIDGVDSASPLPWPGKYPLEMETTRNGHGPRREVGHGTATRVYATVFLDEADAWHDLMEDREVYSAVTGAQTLEAVDKVCTAEPRITNTMKQHLLTYLRDERLKPGKMGSGKYTASQETRWEKLVSAIDAGKLVVAGTAAKANEHEAKNRGMVHGHEYTVLGYEQDDNGVNWVRVRNPWGRYGRDYITSDDSSELQPVARGATMDLFSEEPEDDGSGGISTLEWSDFLSMINELVAA